MTTLRLMEESESESMVDVHHRKSYAQLGSFGTGHTNQRMTTNSPLYTHASLGERTRGLSPINANFAIAQLLQIRLDVRE